MTNRAFPFVFIFIVQTIFVYAQNFQRIFEGSLANDGGVSGGCAWGDYDGDGDADLAVANWDNQHNYIYQNNGDGTFTKLQAIADGGLSSSVSWVDYDNDGDLDLFITNQENQNNYFYKNENGNFKRITDIEITNDFGDSYSAAWADYDNDGYLDLVVANSFNQPNFLYKNLGNGTFKRIVDNVVGRDVSNSFGVSWSDYNKDGLVDLFVANKNNQLNVLYKNTGKGTFEKVVLPPFSQDRGSSNGGSWGDYNNDGYPDLFVANGDFFAAQPDFLYKNNGDGTFTKIEQGVIVENRLASMSGNWIDVDNDGDLDLHVTTYTNQSVIYINDGAGNFEQAKSGPISVLSGYSSGSSVADYDFDGDQDIYVANWENQNNFLFENQAVNNWITIKLQGDKSNRQGIGAKVTIWYSTPEEGKELMQYREIVTNHGFRSQNDAVATFGLGKSNSVKRVQIDWPSGIIDKFKDLDSNQRITIIEGSAKTLAEKPAARKINPVQTLAGEMTKGVDATLLLYDQIRTNPMYKTDENTLNTIAEYALLTLGKFKEVGVLTTHNLKYYPQSGNSFIILGYAKKLTGDIAAAKQNFEEGVKILESKKQLSRHEALLLNTGRMELKNLLLKDSSR